MRALVANDGLEMTMAMAMAMAMTMTMVMVMGCAVEDDDDMDVVNGRSSVWEAGSLVCDSLEEVGRRTGRLRQVPQDKKTAVGTMADRPI